MLYKGHSISKTRKKWYPYSAREREWYLLGMNLNSDPQSESECPDNSWVFFLICFEIEENILKTRVFGLKFWIITDVISTIWQEIIPNMENCVIGQKTKNNSVKKGTKDPKIFTTTLAGNKKWVEAVRISMRSMFITHKARMNYMILLDSCAPS